jgi:hypothetical protein
LAAPVRELLVIQSHRRPCASRGWLAKYNRMPTSLTWALTATKDIPVDLDPVFPFKGEVR